MRWVVAWLAVGLAISAPGAQAGEDAQFPDLPEIAVEVYAGIHRDINVMTIELRADPEISKVFFRDARRPLAIVDSEIGEDCLAVLVIDETTLVSQVEDAVARFGQAGCRIGRLAGSVPEWIVAGLARPVNLRRILKPGDVPFVIPRGLCEAGEPVQTFE